MNVGDKFKYGRTEYTVVTDRFNTQMCLLAMKMVNYMQDHNNKNY